MRTKTRHAPARPAAALLLVTAGLGASLGLSLGAAPAFAGDTTSAGVSASKSARSADSVPPPGSEKSSTYGDENSGSESYDTNWILDASAGDSNAIWYRVTGASIEGTGNVTTGDADSIQRLTKAAWGCEIVTFSIPCSPDESPSITVTNDIDIQAAWTVLSNGTNSMFLDAAAYDINGQKHAMTVSKLSTSSVSVTTTNANRSTSQQSDTTTAGAGANGPSVSDTTVDGSTQEESSSQSQTSTSGSADSGSKELTEVVVRSFNASAVTVTIASAENMDLSACAMIENKQTMVNVPKFNTLNGVIACGSVTRKTSPVSPPPAGPGPGTGGGPTTPGGTSQGPTTPPTGSGPDGQPVTPHDEVPGSPLVPLNPGEPKKDGEPAPPVTPK